ncbi:ribosomal-processing cysteine protease Prp [Apilactobacillus micheneri]|uniref:Ribosomal processing cysteine protease Prp n=1 Tax=Apilactobacillus micheneri TaxID=1899430 RepID=A0A9Q8INW4_9LACO|nr:ribosomal-processing cysteine protease Prp [Apilactobacillus micheneri]TPR40197.1 ribosomal-processing cysteine protease Prp [Apilactobacillus micheneri]TPR40562.1 ribosomal-processing cysteine protease Prp [Apilactobacillus micheneri]TPR42029.1 ribosomal-processing cysteine protease Prp [Apilactobacillus micheneri]TPR44684.1 ribosomal-processing cysteine protease Prp [Apilactobacillus micheneri]TPR44983.1 ribosomal-processing cysteine protease Prp [Apilactobacillus micheneri]
MIKVTISHNNLNDNINSFKITGHADSGEYGKDIVCAAVSVLSITTVNGLNEVAELDPKVKSNDIDGGFMEVTIPNTKNHDNMIASQAILRSFENGMIDISKSYAKYIKLNIIND